MGNCIQTNLISNSDFSISVSAVTVDKTTLQDVPGTLTVDYGHFVYVEATVSSIGSSASAVKGALLKCVRQSFGSLTLQCHPCSASRIIDQTVTYPFSLELSGGDIFYLCELPLEAVAGIVGVFRFAIVEPVASGKVLFSSVAFRLAGFGLNPKDAGLLGLESPALAGLPCPIGNASVELLSGNFSLSVPLFEEKKGTVSIPVVLTYRSPRPDAAWNDTTSGLFGPYWRLSIEHDLTERPDGYDYIDGEGLIHRFRPALTQKAGMQVYYDTSGTHAVLVSQSGTKKIYWPSGASVAFDSSGKGIRVAMRRSETLEDAYDIEYSGGHPYRIKVNGETRVSFDYPPAPVVAVTSAMHGAWGCFTSSDGISSIIDPASRTASFGYSPIGLPSPSGLRGLSSVAYKGRTMSVSRLVNGSTSSSSLTRGSAQEEAVSFAYGALRAEVASTPLGCANATKTTGFVFGEDGECAAEFEVNSNTILAAAGHAFSDQASGNMPNAGNAPQWESDEGYVIDSSSPAAESISAPQGGFCPGSYLYACVSAERFEAGFVPSVDATVKLKNAGGTVIFSATIKHIGEDQSPWFAPLSDSLLSSIASIEVSTATPHYEVTFDAVEIRRLKQGFEKRGCDLDLIPSAGGATLTSCETLTARLTRGDVTTDVSAPTDFRSLLDSLLLSSVVPDAKILFARQGAYVADQISLRSAYGLFFRQLARVDLKSSRESYAPSSSGSGFERIGAKKTLFGRAVLGAMTLYATDFEAFYCGSQDPVRAKETKTTYADWMRETRSATPNSFARSTTYDPSARVTEVTSTVPNPDPNESDKTVLIKKVSYDAGGNVTAEEASSGTSLFGTYYTYEASGRLSEVEASGTSPYLINYCGQEADGVDYLYSSAPSDSVSSRSEEGASFGDVTLRLYGGYPQADLAVISISESVSYGSYSQECSYGDYSLESSMSFHQSGTSSASIAAGQIDIEATDFDVDGRITGRYVGGTKVYAAAYHQYGWKRGMLSSFGPPGNGQITATYDNEGRIAALSRGGASISYSYSVGADASDSKWFEKVAATYSGCGVPLVSEETEKGYSDSYPSGYTRTASSFVSPNIGVSVTVSGGAIPSRRLFCNGPSLEFHETVTYKDDSCAGTGANMTSLPSSSAFYKSSVPGSLALVQAYGRNDSGKIVSMQDTMTVGSIETPLSSLYVARDPITGAIVSECLQVGNAPQQWRTYSYDALGNVLTIGLDQYGSSYLSFTYQDGVLESENGPSGTSYFTFDDAGRMTLRRGEAVTWSGWRITGIAGHGTLQYGPDGLESEQASGSAYRRSLSYVFGRLATETLYDGNLPKIVMNYFYGGDGLVAGFFASYPQSLIYNEGPYFLRRNVLGDVLSIVGPSGAVAHYAYGAFGDTHVLDGDGLVDSNPYSIGNANPFRYRGMRHYTTLGVYCMGARVYDPSLMRFLAPDLPDYLDPMARYGLSPYCYCCNDPLSYVDPTGHLPVLALVLGIMALAGLGLTIGGIASNNNALTAVGLSFIGAAALASGGIALVGAIGSGAILSGIIGGGTMIAGAGSFVFLSAEIQEASGSGNWMKDSVGMSDTLYDQLLLITASAATAGTIASLISHAFQIRSIQDFGRYDKYYGMRFTKGNGKVRVLAFHTHTHEFGPQGIFGWHWQLTKYDQMLGKTTGRIAHWFWLTFRRF